MRSTLFLRVAAIVTVLLGVGHMMGKPWTPAQDPLALIVVTAMQSHSMHVMGFDRTFMDFYLGFGLLLGVALFLQAALLWITAGLVSLDPIRARWIAACFLLANAVQTVIAGAYLFTAPLVLSLLVTLCLGAAVMSMRRAPSAELSAS